MHNITFPTYEQETYLYNLDTRIAASIFGEDRTKSER